MDRIENYYKKYSGRIFLLGNGPSLLENDLSKLDPTEVMTMNRSWREVPSALFHCANGDLRVPMAVLPKHIIFLGQESQYRNFRLGCPVILIQTLEYGTRIEPFKKVLPVPAEIDLRRGWPKTHCGLLATYCAWWLGFNPLYLLGFDGYGGHYTEKDRNIIPNHQKIIGEFVDRVGLLLTTISELRVYNCNPQNKYMNLPIASYDKLC